MSELLPVLRFEFERHKNLAQSAMAELDDESFFRSFSGGAANSVAVVVKHVGGNLRSRWTDFLTSDGEKPDRNRDNEFQIGPGDDRASLLAAWATGWQAVFEALDSLKPEDLDRSITIRGEPHTVVQALLRSLTHTTYHIGQITYLCRMLKPDSPFLTITPGQSGAARGRYLQTSYKQNRP